MENYIGDINIGGTLFKLEGQLLVQRDVKVNALPLSLLNDQGDNLMGYIDHLDARLFSPRNLSSSKMNIDAFYLLKEYVEGGHKNMETIRKLNTISITRRMEVVMIDDHMNERLNGILPRAKFLNTWYQVDLRAGLLRNLNNPEDCLTIPERTAYYGNNYYYYYLQREHVLQAVDLNAKHVPKGARLLEVPVFIDICDIDPELRNMSRTPLEKLSSMHLLWDTELRLLDLKQSNLKTILRENATGAAPDPDLARGFYVKPGVEVSAQQQHIKVTQRSIKGRSVH